jgi:hypothetical protein
LRKDIEKILGEKIPVMKKEEKPKEEKKEEDIWSSLREKWKRLASY